MQNKPIKRCPDLKSDKKPQHIINKEKFFSLLDDWGIEYQKEFYFCKDDSVECAGAGGNRLWRFDVAFPKFMLAVEIEGGTFTGGRHTTGVGYKNDIDKYNSAQIMGWTVLRATTSMVGTEEFAVFLFDALTSKGAIR